MNLLACIYMAQFSISNFQVSLEESATLSQLRESIFEYMVLKEVQTTATAQLPGLHSFLNRIRYTSTKNEKSSVVMYVDILSLPADSKDTYRS